MTEKAYALQSQLVKGGQSADGGKEMAKIKRLRALGG